jgi:hypothetical protein
VLGLFYLRQSRPNGAGIRWEATMNNHGNTSENKFFDLAACMEMYVKLRLGLRRMVKTKITLPYPVEIIEPTARASNTERKGLR